MKSLFFALLIASALSISLVSCKKESTSTSFPPPYHPFTTDLVAGRWVKICDPTYLHNGECALGHTMYVDSFPGALNTENLSCGCTIKVYLVLSDGKQIQINGQEVMFMGSGLQATVRDSNIEIEYRSNATTLPFSFLAIKVVGN